MYSFDYLEVVSPSQPTKTTNYTEAMEVEMADIDAISLGKCLVSIYRLIRLVVTEIMRVQEIWKTKRMTCTVQA